MSFLAGASMGQNLAMGAGLLGLGKLASQQKARPVTTTNAPWQAQQPYLKGLFKSALDLKNTPLDARTLSALEAERNAINAGTSDTGIARSRLGSLLDGDLYKTAQGAYLDPNSQHYRNMYQMATQPTIEAFSDTVVPNIQSEFANAGRYGSGAYARARNNADKTLSRALFNVNTNLYENERTRQAQAQTRLGNLLRQYAGMQGSEANRLMAIDPTSIRQQRLGQYKDLISGGYGGVTTGTEYGPSKTASMIGSAMQIAGLGHKMGMWGRKDTNKEE